MKHPERDLSILRHIVTYCDQIEEAVEHFGADYDSFAASAIYRNSVALCILQIGELVGNLTDEFKGAHPNIPWRQIKGMRNIVAHKYGTVDAQVTWEIVVSDIPELKQFCTETSNHSA